MIWLSILYLFICLYIHLSSIYLSIYPSFHSFIYWIIINTFLLTTSRCLSILLSLWLHNYLSSPATARKICLYIQQFIYLSISSNKSILSINLVYIFLKSVLWDTLYFHFFSCMLFVFPLSQFFYWSCKGG